MAIEIKTNLKCKRDVFHYGLYTGDIDKMLLKLQE
jgi:hypothetical protein